MAKKILFIEDEEVLAQMYYDRFTQAGFKVVLAYSAKDGLEACRREKPDLVILDILLPRENGIFFLEGQKKDPDIASIPVVAFSNYDDPETKKEALELGVKEYLIKTNYTPREIVEKIKRYLTE